MTHLSRLARIIGLLALAAALAACSAVKLGYNNIDDIAYWWLDSYVDFNQEQTPRVREDLTRLQLWHRRQELPQVVEILHGMEDLAPNDVNAAQACQIVAKVRERLNVLASQAEPAMVTLATKLTPEQLQHIERKYEKNNADYRKEWLDPPTQEQAEKRFQLYLERGEMMYGRLEEPQRTALRRQIDQSIFDPARALAERQRRQQDALQTLRKLAGQPVSLTDARSVMHGLLERALNPPDPVARAYQQALIDEGCRNFADLHNSSSVAQRETAARRLRAYQRDFRELAAQQ